MLLKRAVSLIMSGAIGLFSAVTAFPTTIVADAAENNGFTQEEIDKSEIKPEVYITVDGQKYGKVYNAADIAGKTLKCSLNVWGANEEYVTTGFHIYYDERLELTKDKDFGTINVSAGKAIEKTSPASPKEDTSLESSGMKGLFVASSGSMNKGENGAMWTFELKVPSNAKKGDYYPIDIMYRQNLYSEDLFVNAECNNAGQLMQAYVFTRGIFNNTTNKNFQANAGDLYKCPQLANIDKSYDGFIAISDEPTPVTTMPAEQTDSTDRLTFNNLNLPKDGTFSLHIHGDPGDTIQVHFYYTDSTGENCSYLVGGLGGTVLDEIGNKTVSFTAPCQLDSLTVKVVYSGNKPKYDSSTSYSLAVEGTTSTSSTSSTTTSTTKATTTTTVSSTVTTTSTEVKTAIAGEFFPNLVPLEVKVYKTEAEIVSVENTDGNVAVPVISDDRMYLSITAANEGKSETTIYLSNGDVYKVYVTVTASGNIPDISISTSTATTTTTTTPTTTTSTTTTTTTATSTTTTTTTTTTSTTTTTTTTTTASTTTTVVTNTAISFNRETDTWGFTNSGVEFWDSNGMLLLENELEKLESIKKYYNKPTLNTALDNFINSHAGSCFGMTSLALLCSSDKDHYLPLIHEGADCLKSVELDDDLRSKINYYCALQMLPEIRYAIADFAIREKTETNKVKRILELINDGPVLICYRVTDNAAGKLYSHAVIAYEVVSYVPGKNEDDEFFDSLKYTYGSDSLKMIKVYDPNYPNYDENPNIFVNAVEQESGDIKYYWGIKEHFAYNKKPINKSILFVTNNTRLINNYGLFDDENTYASFDPKKFYPELDVETYEGNESGSIELEYNSYDIISAPILDDEPYILLPGFYGDTPASHVVNYILKYNNQDYAYKYNDGSYRKTGLKMQYPNTFFSVDSELRSASFSNNSVSIEIKKDSKFTLNAISDSMELPNGFYEIKISGTSPANGTIRCDYDSGLWHITSSVPLNGLDIFVTNGTDCFNQHRSYSPMFNKITLQYSALEATRIMITETLSDISLGDINNDGYINSQDASYILVEYSRISTGGVSVLKSTEADIDGDGRVDSKDASYVLKYYAYASTTEGEIKTLKEFMNEQ